MGSYRRGGLLEILRVTLGCLLALSFGIFVFNLIPIYEQVDRDGDSSFVLAYAVATVGVIAAAVVALGRMVGRVRAGLPVGWAPLVAVPILACTWVLGLLIALAIEG
ncbi:hypothetical protein ACWEKT_03710 [Nocardia takedensis]